MKFKKKNKNQSANSPQKENKKPNKIIKVLDIITSMIAFALLIWLTIFLTDNAIEFIQKLFM